MSLFCLLAVPLGNCWENPSAVEPWIRRVRCSLVFDLGRNRELSQEMRHLLLSEEDSDCFDGLIQKCEEDEDAGTDDSEWLFHGVPRRPLYKDLAVRLFRWSRRRRQQEHDRTANSVLLQKWETEIEEIRCRLMVPGEELGFQELDDRPKLSIPPSKTGEISSWLAHVNDACILRILGLRHTIGGLECRKTASIVMVPSWKQLQQAAEELHHPNSSLTVAARARSKHAHRGKDQFFGIAKGSVESQNEETRRILQGLMEDAAWINLHKFGGMEDDNIVAEIRLLHGYGARWMFSTDSSPKEGTSKALRVKFRGFLEPQIAGGHERGWRH